MKTEGEIIIELNKELENYRWLSMEISIEKVKYQVISGDLTFDNYYDNLTDERILTKHAIEILCWILGKDAKEQIDLIMHR